MSKKKRPNQKLISAKATRTKRQQKMDKEDQRIKNLIELAYELLKKQRKIGATKPTGKKGKPA